jgi:hypothetical protein
MDKEDVIAKMVLSEFERKEKLRKIINESAWHYYFGNARCLIAMLLVFAFFYGMPYLEKDTRVYWWIFIIANFIFGEISRLNARFNAFAKLYEIEKEEKNENKVVSPNSDSAAAKPE